MKIQNLNFPIIKEKNYKDNNLSSAAEHLATKDQLLLFYQKNAPSNTPFTPAGIIIAAVLLAAFADGLQGGGRTEAKLTSNIKQLNDVEFNQLNIDQLIKLRS